MTTARKRVLSMALTLCMVLSMMPTVYATADEKFSDVSADAWYYESVEYVTKNGYFNGTGDGVFSPQAPATRAMFVTVLARLDGHNANDNVQPFDDVTPGAWYAGEVLWASKNGIVSGIGNNNFGPDQNVTRQQMAAFMARYIAYYAEENDVTFKATGSDEEFADADDIADYAVEAVALCRSYGLVDGVGEGRFEPEGTSTRAQVAAVIHRLALLLETVKPEKDVTKPSAGSNGGGNNSGGGGNNGGGSSSVTTVADTASDFIKAAEKNKNKVTATIAETNYITVNDDISITNDYASTLTLNLGAAKTGKLTINAAKATTININGDEAAVASLVINAPKATVNNKAAVDGSVDIKAVSNSTFNNGGKISGTITLSGSGAVNDTSAEPAHVVIATDESVTVRGNSTVIDITADNANVNVNTENATINSSANDVTVKVDSKNATIGGTVKKLTTTAKDPELTINGTVNELNANSSDTITLNGGGAVDTLSATKTDLTVSGDGAKALSIGTVAASNGATITAPDGVIDTVDASGTVNLNASVQTVTAKTASTLNVGEEKTVNTVESSSNLTLGGAGKINSVDVKSNSTVAVAGDATVGVTQITSPEGVEVKTSGESLPAPVTKAAKPAVQVEAPTSAGGKGSITGLNAEITYEYKNVTDSEWSNISEKTSQELAAGTYQLRVKATETSLASEIVTVTIPAAVGVNAAAIQGTPYVGQTLTAVANATATGNLSYEWKADGDETIIGEGKTLLLTDDHVGKTITVRIYNYAGKTADSDKQDTATSAATAKITVDKTALTRLIAKAEEVKLGVAVKDDGTTAAQVAEGIIFVTAGEDTALATAKAEADKVAAGEYAATATTAGVTGAESALRAAIDTYIKAKKVGINNVLSELKTELAALIEDAGEIKLADSKVNTAAVNVEPNTEWVLKADQDIYAAAIEAANAAKDSEEAEVVAKAITDLNAATTAYIKVIRKGAELDNTALVAAINAAEINAASVVVSADGADVLPSQSWVTAEGLKTYNAAIDTAKAVAAKTQQENITAVDTLKTATETFNTAKKAGTKDIVAPVVTFTKASVGNAYTINVTSNEAGSYKYQAGSTEGTWLGEAALTGAGTPYTGTVNYTLDAASTVVYIQVSDKSGNTTIVSVPVGEEIENPAASIGSTKYETLSEAIAAATNGQTVRLEKDVELGAQFALDKSLTLDLNGHTASRDNGNDFVQVINDATLTIDGTTEGSTFYGRINVGIANNNNGNVILNGGSYSCAEGNTVLHINGTCLSSNVTITGATIESPNDNGIQLNGKGMFVIKDSTITGATAVYVKAGKLTITNSTLTGNMSPANYAYYGNGAYATGDALVIDACNYPGGNPTVIIESGSFTGTKAAIGYYQHKGAGEEPGVATITINGGTFSDMSWVDFVADGATVKLGKDVELADVDQVDAADAGVTFSGKDFTLDLNGNTISHANRPIKVESGNVTITGTGEIKETTTVESYKRAAITVMGSTDSNAKDYTTVTIGENVTLTGLYGAFVTPNSTRAYGVTVNFNGKTNGLLYVNGQIQHKDNCPVFNVGATAVSEGGIYAAGYAQWTIADGAVISGETALEAKAGEITIDGGTFTTTVDTPSSATNNNGGSTSGYAVAAVSNPNYAGHPLVTINGGTFNGPVAIVDDDGDPENNTAKITINGGTFSDMSWVDFVADGATVKLGKDVTLTKDLLFSKENVTLDLDGKVITTDGYTLAVKAGKLTVTGDGTIANAIPYVEQGEDGKAITDPHKIFTVDAGAELVIESGTYTTKSTEIIYTEGTATVKDGTFTCNIGDVYHSEYDGKCIMVSSGEKATLTVEAGTLTSTEGEDLCGMNGVYALNGATIVLGKEDGTGPSITTDYSAIGTNNHTATSNVTIYGGEYTIDVEDESISGSSEKFATVMYLACDGNYNIYGGTFTAGNGSRTHAISIPYKNTVTDLTITGGEFISGGSVFYIGTQKGDFGKLEAGTEKAIVIEGGTFSSEPDVKFLAEGYEAVEDDNGGWTVAPAEVTPATQNLLLDAQPEAPVEGKPEDDIGLGDLGEGTDAPAIPDSGEGTEGDNTPVEQEPQDGEAL